MGSFRPGDPAAVQELFEQIAPRYDQLNDLLSFGLHRLWKRQAVAWLQPRPGWISAAARVIWPWCWRPG
jgi:demethylmenaquinone methyltransferase/2-methoxy-6-polyprenyl-1,4-benzoquinol methylase